MTYSMQEYEVEVKDKIKIFGGNVRIFQIIKRIETKSDNKKNIKCL